MSKFQFVTSDYNKKNNINQYIFYCPGCETYHFVQDKGIGPNWRITGLEKDKPTVKPSIRVRSGRNMEEICHSFITDGEIKFLTDSTHKLSGQKIRIPDFDN